MYELTINTAEKRTYKSSQTGTELTTRLIYTSEDGAKWWGFDDLISMPFIRKKAAESLLRLHGAGIDNDDLMRVVNQLKTVLKGNDVDKYERSYAEVLQLEDIAKKTADPIRQHLSLCPLYILADDENIDTFNSTTAQAKMERWANNPDEQSFFLNYLTDGMTAYLKLSGLILETVSKQQEKL